MGLSVDLLGIIISTSDRVRSLQSFWLDLLFFWNEIFQQIWISVILEISISVGVHSSKGRLLHFVGQHTEARRYRRNWSFSVERIILGRGYHDGSIKFGLELLSIEV